MGDEIGRQADIADDAHGGPTRSKASHSPLAMLLNLTYGASGLPGNLVSWPNPSAARIAFPADDAAIAKWFQRTGLLGGGGSRLSRAILRRMPVSALIRARKARESLRAGNS